VPGAAGDFNYMIEQPNRGTRSIGLNLASDDGREVLYRLAETSDVFLTSTGRTSASTSADPISSTTRASPTPARATSTDGSAGE
jgi:CoA-transferase family III